MEYNVRPAAHEVLHIHQFVHIVPNQLPTLHDKNA